MLRIFLCDIKGEDPDVRGIILSVYSKQTGHISELFNLFDVAESEQNIFLLKKIYKIAKILAFGGEMDLL